MKLNELIEIIKSNGFNENFIICIIFLFFSSLAGLLFGLILMGLFPSYTDLGIRTWKFR